MFEHLRQHQRSAGQGDLGDLVRHAALSPVVEVLLGRVGRSGTVKARGDFLGQHDLGVLGVAPRHHFSAQRGNALLTLKGQQREPAPHQIVADRQHLGEHGVGRLGDADVVVLALGHLLDAVQAFEQRHGQDALWLLAVLLLQVAAHQQVELLVGAAQFQIALERDTVIALHQRVQEFVHADRHARGEAVVEIVALHHACHGVLGGQLDHAARTERITPLTVVTDLGARRVQHQRGLLVIGLGVGLDLLARQRRAGVVAARGVANHRGEIADQEDHLVAEVLQLAHLVQHHGVADVDVRRRRVQAQLDAQRHAAGLRARQLLHPVVLRNQFLAATQGDGQGLLDLVGDEGGGCF